MCMRSSCTWPFYSLCVSPVFSPFVISLYSASKFPTFPRAARRLVCFLLSNHLIVLNSKNSKEKKKTWSSCLELQTQNATTAVNWNECTCVVYFPFSFLFSSISDSHSGSLCIVLSWIRSTLSPFCCCPLCWMHMALAIMINHLKSGACRERMCVVCRTRLLHDEQVLFHLWTTTPASF